MNKVLVAGVGNIFLGDDGFGVEVARRLRERVQPAGVQVADFGIRALDLGYALQDGYAAAILVDVAQRGGPPGSLYVIEPDGEEALDDAGVHELMLSPHDLDPNKMLRLVRRLGGECEHIVFVACEPESFGTEVEGEGRMGLSVPVAAAVDKAVELIETLAVEMMEREKSGQPVSV